MRAVILGLLWASAVAAADPSQRYVYPGRDGKLVYDADERGNRIPDFSHCGYAGGEVPILDVPVRVVVAPGKGDGTARIQAAIDYVSGLKPDEKGCRGTVLILAGRHEVATSLRVAASGVVLRGAGPGNKGTVLVATGTDRRTLIEVRGKNDRRFPSDRIHRVTDKYTPAGAIQLKLDTTKGLTVGDTIVVEHPSTKEWIAALGMDRFATADGGSWLDWRPGTLDLRWDRSITRIDGDTITLDAPLSTALDAAHGGGRVRIYSWPGRICQVGVENLQCESAYDRKNPHDEQHSWTAISLESARDVWVRQVKAVHFAGSAVSVWETCRHVTIEDCESIEPVSEIGGYRRHTFYTSGQLTLLRRCKSDGGRHDFAAGYLAAGPNAFVHCAATNAHQFSGPIESWASGVLYDNVTIDGGGLSLTNREIDGHGVGWAAANCVLWQCTASVITCRKPPTAQNWAIGCWGQFVGDGHWRSMNQSVKPQSLYAAQLADRLGDRAVENGKRRAIPIDPGEAKTIDDLGPDLVRKRSQPVPVSKKPLKLQNGWLVCDGKLLTGGRTGTAWWRGHILPARTTETGKGVTRFVPGRVGAGYTDDLDELTDAMREQNKVVLEHHWGLWYDRRRDDHQMVRRIDGEVWPPFYEQPWARSGQGKAWDGLSKYDLTKFNSWYFDRLKAFADHCECKGMVLVQHMYFQHNVLEAGAHWADFPWRPANCLQETGFAEPPPYANNKRVFMADAFYDVKHPVRRELHRAYIRHCLDVLGDNTNVIFTIGDEFTGPRAFVEFWLDTIAQWQKEKKRKVLVALSCTRDVQDAVLADKERGPLVSVIDMKYWWYTSNGGVYDPKGGASLSPRQQLREWKGNKSRSDASIARQVREYRAKYPDRAILCSLAPANPWTVVAAGGSIPPLPLLIDTRLLEVIPRLKPLAQAELSKDQWALADPGRDYLVHAGSADTVRLDLSSTDETFVVYWVNPKSGERKKGDDLVVGGKTITIPRPSAMSILWLTRK
jgi:hypothetical protein